MPQEIVNSEINVEVEMDESSVWQKNDHEPYAVNDTNIILESQQSIQDTYVSDSTKTVDSAACTSSVESVITTRYIGYTPNISDLIIEQSNISNNTVVTTSPAAETSEPEPQTMTVFSLNSATSTRTEQVVETSKDEPVVHTYVKSIEQIESVYVKADCSDTIYSLNSHQLEPQLEQPESTLLQMETSEQKEPQIISEPITPPGGEESAEESSTPSVVQLQVPESSQIQTEQPESSTSSTEPTPSTSTTVAAIITTTTIEAEPSEPSVSSEAHFQEQPMDTSSVESSQMENVDQPEPEPSETCSTTTVASTEHSTRQEVQEDIVHHSSNEETISSSDEKPNSSAEAKSDTFSAVTEVTEVSRTPDEEEVTESNIDSEYTVSQTTEGSPEIAVRETPEVEIDTPSVSAAAASSPSSSSSTTVTDQSIVIGPEDMQVEDISPPNVNSPTEVQPSEATN